MNEILVKNIKKTLHTDNIIILTINYDDYLEYVPVLFTSLSKEESLRSERIIKTSDRQKYIIRKAILREILSLYFTTDKQDISYDKNPFGKPYCIRPSICRFNLSHSKDVVTYIISDKYEVGIDIEYKGKERSFVEIAKTCFTKDESYQVEISENKSAVFYKIWTAKEAVLKADGIGLMGGIKSINVADIIKQNETIVNFRKSIYLINNIDYTGKYTISYAYRVKPI